MSGLVSDQVSGEVKRPSLDSIRDCLEGAIPGVMATSGEDGMPNVAYLSQVEYLDSDHVALSFQFFNKTRRNVLANPLVQLLVVRPTNGAMFRIDVRYLRTETEGPLFERMKAKLAGIASHSGMSGVFKLLGSDVYRVVSVEEAAAGHATPPPSGRQMLPALRRGIERLLGAGDLDGLLQAVMHALQFEFGFRHAMILLLDPATQHLYTVASCGYGLSGAGSEIAMGQGVIGVAARERTPIRISHFTAEYAYSQAIRAGVVEHGDVAALQREIPLPGLATPRSQLAVPIIVGAAPGRDSGRSAGETLGVLFAESDKDMCFSFDDEDALVCLASPLGQAMRQFQRYAEAADAADSQPAAFDPIATPSSKDSVAATTAPTATPATAATPTSEPMRVRYFEADSSVFFDNDYLIKGVAGAVLWKLVRDYVEAGRTEFSNRELRLAREIRLPDVGDNLEARLVLLARRLIDRQAGVQIEKTGRGRHRLRVARPLALEIGS